MIVATAGRAVNWRYRFFEREPTLLRRDPTLRKAFLAFQRAHLRQLDSRRRAGGP
jgi:hypothetical protein